MKTYQSPTSNGGKTIVLETAADAIAAGSRFVEENIALLESRGDEKLNVNKLTRDGKSSKGKPMLASTLAGKWKESRKRFEKCVEAITKGDESIKSSIAATLELLRDAAVEIEPMLAVGYRGYERSEDGFSADAGLVAAGEEKPCFQRKRGSEEMQKRAGDGAFRIVINTDVSWFGKPDDNCAVMGALVTLLQQFGPVEVWIQQGWMDGKDGTSPDNGVTLFKLDFTGSFDATALYFWLGHHDKDACFSYIVSRALERKHAATSITSEIPCDLYMRGDWLKCAGITAEQLAAMLHTERIDVMATWVSQTAMKITHPELAVIDI